MPRAGLDRATVVAAAAEVADEQGLAKLSMGLVAERLGVRPPSLYKHVEGLAELQQGVATLAAVEMAEALREAMMGYAGRDALAAAARAMRGYIVGHRGRYEATVGAVPEPELQAAADRVMTSLAAVLRGYRIAPADETHALRAIRSALHGFATIEAGQGFQWDTDVDASFDWLVDFLDRSLTALAAPVS